MAFRHPIRVGNRDGSRTVLAVDEVQETVLCLTSVGAQPFVTWQVDDAGGTYWGHYFDSLGLALEDFVGRSQKVARKDAITRQREWIRDHGETLQGYVDRYGSRNDPSHYGSGGEAIWLADVEELVYRLQREGRDAGPELAILLEVRRDFGEAS